MPGPGTASCHFSERPGRSAPGSTITSGCEVAPARSPLISVPIAGTARAEHAARRVWPRLLAGCLVRLGGWSLPRPGLGPDRLTVCRLGLADPLHQLALLDDLGRR